MITEGEAVTFSATATDSSDTDISNQVEWKIGEELATGATFTYTASTPGQIRVRAKQWMPWVPHQRLST